MQELEAPVLQLPSGGGNGVGVGDLELEADLRQRAIGRPLAGPEAGPGGLAQRPDAEVLGALDLLAVEVVIVGGALQRKAEGVDVQLATPWGIGGDHSDAGDE